MATTTVSAGADSANVKPTIEDAYADLVVCDTLILAVGKFVDEIRAYSAPNDGIRPDEYVFGPALRAMTLIDEARDRLQEGKLRINCAVDVLCRPASAK